MTAKCVNWIHNISRNGVICLSMLHCFAAKRRKDLAQTQRTEIVSRKKGRPLYIAQRNAISNCTNALQRIVLDFLLAWEYILFS